MTPVNSLKNVLSTTASSKGCSDAMQTLKCEFKKTFLIHHWQCSWGIWSKSCVLIGYLILLAWDCLLCSHAWKMLHGADSQWCNFWTMLAMELQKVVEGNQNKNINNSPGFIVLQTQLPSFVALQLNKSFLILDKEKSFCYKIYLLLTKLV